VTTPSAAAANSAPVNANWRHPALPRRQWQLVARQLRDTARGRPPLVFRVGAEALGRVSGECRTLLDVGCSTGYYCEVFDRLLGRRRKLSYTGCDLSPEMVRLARERYPGRRFDVQDITSLSYEDKTFDVVFTGAVLCNCDDYVPAFEQLARVARHYLVLHRLYLSGGEDLRRQRRIYDTVDVPDVSISRTRLERLAGERGFTRTKEIPIAPGQITWVLRRGGA
jgi:SAM-dependent methyltransferase